MVYHIRWYNSFMHQPSPPQAPGFAPLLCAGLQSVGVTFLSLDHVRRAKKGLSTEVERLLLSLEVATSC